MREIQASEAAGKLSELLDAVERGENITICRNGRRVARLVPDPERRRQETEEAIADIKRLRKTTGKITLEELLSSIHEGYKY